MVTYGNAPGYHQEGNLSESSERNMEVLFLTFLWAPVYLP